MTTGRLQRDERGQVAGVETVVFGVLVFVAGLLIATNGWSVLTTRNATSSIAREYLRAYTRQTNEPAARRAGRSAAATVRDTERIRPARVAIVEPARFGPCVDASVTVTVQVPLARLPFLGEVGSTSVSVTRHERIDAYRARNAIDDGADHPCTD
jgi:hypothetical protein